MGNIWLDLFIVVVFIYATGRGIHKTAEKRVRQEQQRQQKASPRRKRVLDDDELESMGEWFEPGTRAEDY
jgi:hypothetical protein